MLANRCIPGFLLISLFLSACQPQAPAAAPTPKTWQVTLDSNLAWLGTNMSQCLINLPGTAIALQEAPFSQIDDAGSDIILMWGHPQTFQENMFTLGWDDWVMVVHPENSIASITTSQARSILNGKTRTWNKLVPELEEKDDVKLGLWVYPAADQAQLWFRSALGASSSLPANARIAPGAQAMLEAVAENKNAFGFIPSRWVAPSVKIVPISDLAEDALRQPIVAMLPTATADQQAWLACLQTSLAAAPPAD